MLNFEHLFSKDDVAKHEVEIEKKGELKKVQRQADALAYQIAAKDKKRGAPKVYKYMGTMHDAESFAENETNLFVGKKKWERLGLWYQWFLVNEYIKNLPQSMNERQVNVIKDAIKNGTIEKVDYDIVNKRVLKLNYFVQGIGDI